MRDSIRKRLTLAFIGLAIGPLLLVGVILAWQSFITQEQQALNLQREVAQHVSSQVKAFLDGLENELRLVSQIQELQKLDRDKQRIILAELLARQNAFESLDLLDSQGQEQVRLARASVTPAEELGNRAKSDEFAIPQMSGRAYYSPVHFNETTGEPFITMAVPLQDIRTGLVDGVLVSEVRLQEIWDLITDLQTSPGQSVYIVDAQNKVVVHRNVSVVLRGTTFHVPYQNGIQPGLASVNPILAVDTEGLSIQSLVARLTSPNVVLAVDTIRFGEQEFNIIAEQTVAEALALAITTILVTVSLIVVALVMSAALGLVIVRQVVQPIQAMATTAQAISAGDLSRQVRVTSRDEVGVLAAAFNSMTAQLRQNMESLERQIVEVKQAEESLRRANETLQALIDYSPLAIIMLDLNSHILLWNNAAEKMYGWTAQEALGEFIPFVPEDKREELRAISERVTQGDIFTNMELERRHKDGSRIWVGVSIAPLRDSTGSVYAHIIIATNITERKKMEDTLRLTQFCVDRASVGIMRTGLDATILSVNDEMCRNLGYTREELCAMHTLDIDPTLEMEGWRAHRQYLHAHGSARVERIYRRKDGTTFPVEITNSYLEFQGDEFAFSFVLDITERHRAEQALRESEERLRQIASSLREVVWLRDAQTRQVLYVNPAFEELTGRTCASFYEHRDIVRDTIHPDDKEWVIKALNQRFEGVPYNQEHRIIHLDGSARWVSSRSFPVRNEAGEVYRWVSIMEDITGRKQAEEEKARLESQLLHAQKMESVGRLAGGVAHDFNNMLSVILGYAELMKSQLPDSDPLLKDVVEIEKAGLRSRDITRQLLAFSRKQIIAPKPVNLNDLIRSTQQTLARLIGEDIDLRFHPEKNLWQVKFDSSQIDQILVNLAVNARDAMPTGGKLTIETANISLDEAYCREHLEFTPGHYVLLEVSDSGIGMDKETLAHIFEPFFTTKEVGKGTGLGLATVYGIVKQNDGFINLYSEPGQGTTFKIYIPRFIEEVEITEEGEEVLLISGAGTVLLVEDDMLVREMTKAMLETIGYTVLVAETPADALSLCAQPDTPIDLLITDVVMPEISGPELRDKIKAIRPGIKVLFMSGYTSNVIVHRGVLEEGVHFIQKPFGMNDLARKVRLAIGDK